MPRWEPDARARLEEAALSLYDKRGFDRTTVEEIAEQAGLTKRTFFRHFADKREVLFRADSNFDENIATAVRSAPTNAHALEAAAHGVYALAAALDAQGAHGVRRIRIVRASPELWERQLIKFASLAQAIARALRSRGVGDRTAVLAAESAMTALRVASDRWVAGNGKRSLHALVVDALAELRAVAGAGSESWRRRKRRIGQF